VAQAEQMACGRSSADLVIRLDRAVLRKCVAVDEHHRDARAPDLFDLRVVFGKADGHKTVDGRTAKGPDQRPVSGETNNRP